MELTSVIKKSGIECSIVYNVERWCAWECIVCLIRVPVNIFVIFSVRCIWGIGFTEKQNLNCYIVGRKVNKIGNCVGDWVIRLSSTLYCSLTMVNHTFLGCHIGKQSIYLNPGILICWKDWNVRWTSRFDLICILSFTFLLNLSFWFELYVKLEVLVKLHVLIWNVC